MKFAALGDVAIAARALHEFASSVSEECALEVHWFIDARYAGLAEAILQQRGALHRLSVQWHPVDSAALFKGTLFEKMREAIRLARALKRLWVDAHVLLHRDGRYRALIRSISYRPIYGVTRAAIPEGEAYAGVFEALARAQGFEAGVDAPDEASMGGAIGAAPAAFDPKHIGILVGGAQNPRGVYREKRWTRFAELARELRDKTDLRVSLYGAPEDQPVAQEVLAAVDHDPRFTNRIAVPALADLPAELASLGAFISIDSGLAHIAASVMTQSGQRVITLFGPTSAQVWAPRASGAGRVGVLRRDLECSPCYRDDGNFDPCIYTGDSFQRCMTEITPAHVLEALPNDSA